MALTKKVADKKKSAKKDAAPKGSEFLREQSLAERVLLSGRMTEKAYVLGMLNQYVFRVAKGATKDEVRRAVEAAYGVHVDKVRTINVASRKRTFGRTIGRTAGMRKAVVTLSKGEEIVLSKGV